MSETQHASHAIKPLCQKGNKVVAAQARDRNTHLNTCQLMETLQRISVTLKCVFVLCIMTLASICMIEDTKLLQMIEIKLLILEYLEAYLEKGWIRPSRESCGHINPFCSKKGWKTIFNPDRSIFESAPRRVTQLMRPIFTSICGTLAQPWVLCLSFTQEVDYWFCWVRIISCFGLHGCHDHEPRHWDVQMPAA